MKDLIFIHIEKAILIKLLPKIETDIETLRCLVLYHKDKTELINRICKIGTKFFDKYFVGVYV